MVVKEINDAGGLLDGRWRLFIEDTPPRGFRETKSVLLQFPQTYFSATRLISCWVVSRGSNAQCDQDVSSRAAKRLYIYIPPLYEGKECNSLPVRTGPTPAASLATNSSHG